MIKLVSELLLFVSRVGVILCCLLNSFEVNVLRSIALNSLLSVKQFHMLLLKHSNLVSDVDNTFRLCYLECFFLESMFRDLAFMHCDEHGIIFL